MFLSGNSYNLLHIVTCPKGNTKKVKAKTTKLCINTEKCFIYDTEIKFGYLGRKSALNEPKKVICSCFGKNSNECRPKYCKNIRTNPMK